MSLLKRLERIENHSRMQEKRSYVFHIGKGEDFETREALDKELEKPKYQNATSIIVDDIKYQVEQMSDEDKTKYGLQKYI